MRTLLRSAACTGMSCGRDSGNALGRSTTSRSGDFKLRILGVTRPVVRISTLVPSRPRTTDTPRTCTSFVWEPLSIDLALAAGCAGETGADTAAGEGLDSFLDGAAAVFSVVTVTRTALLSVASRTSACGARVNSTRAILVPFAAL